MPRRQATLAADSDFDKLALGRGSGGGCAGEHKDHPARCQRLRHKALIGSLRRIAKGRSPDAAMFTLAGCAPICPLRRGLGWTPPFGGLLESIGELDQAGLAACSARKTDTKGSRLRMETIGERRCGRIRHVAKGHDDGRVTRLRGNGRSAGSGKRYRRNRAPPSSRRPRARRRHPAARSRRGCCPA